MLGAEGVFTISSDVTFATKYLPLLFYSRCINNDYLRSCIGYILDCVMGLAVCFILFVCATHVFLYCKT